MENEIIEEQENLTPLNFNGEIQRYLYNTAKWGKFIAIVGFVIVGLLILIGIVVGFAFSFIKAANPSLNGFSGGGQTIIFLIVAVFYFVPTYYLYLFSTSAKKGIDYQSESDLIRAFSNLKSLYKFQGILMLIAVVFYTLFFVLALIASLSFLNQG